MASSNSSFPVPISFFSSFLTFFDPFGFTSVSTISTPPPSSSSSDIRSMTSPSGPACGAGRSFSFPFPFPTPWAKFGETFLYFLVALEEEFDAVEEEAVGLGLEKKEESVVC
jgi:hypothetical protein